MNNKKTTEYISLEEATKYCPYSQEYLSLRARQGKLKAIKLGRNWVTKKEWLEEYLSEVEEVKEEHLSLQEATKYCQYSQEYLSLRARQGKLRATKIGRNWVTKKEWLKEYLAEVEEYNNLKAERIKELRKVPIAEPEFIPVRVPVREFPVLRLGLALGLILILITGGFFGRIFLQDVLEEVSLFASTLFKAGDMLKDVLENFKEYGQWAGNKIFAGIKTVAKLWQKPERIVEEKEGMVVISSTDEDELMKEKIRLAFSDQVRVEPKDKTTGIVIPIFRTGEGQEYLYVMVPVKEEN